MLTMWDDEWDEPEDEDPKAIVGVARLTLS